ncbi:MAG TPA: type II toxin-antitoxin system HicB family antitoxin [Conexibacter sp.]|nr:type II toxin-antitoxin system HicB family antitoxin [Conexibacter sp.]
MEVATGHHICAVEEASLMRHSGRVSARAVIVYEVDQDGWVVASIPRVPGVHSQGRSREAARANVIDALRGMLDLRTASVDDIPLL